MQKARGINILWLGEYLEEETSSKNPEVGETQEEDIISRNEIVWIQELKGIFPRNHRPFLCPNENEKRGRQPEFQPWSSSQTR